MAETLNNSIESNSHPDGLSDPPAPSSDGSFFHRRIEFHLARKPFTGFSNGGGGGDFRLETLNPSSDPQRPRSNQGTGPLALSGKKADGSEFLENGLDPELNFGITFRRIGAGLENLGNTCFLNSVLQCLTYTEPLAAYLQSGKHQISCRMAGFCALCAIQKHVSRALQSTGRILAPKDLVSNLRCVSRNFRNSRQEDAHEYMVNLLESMHKCCLPSGVPSESPSAFEKSLVHKIFGGRLRSQVKCMQCSFCSNKFDPFLDLSLEIVKAESLHKAIAHFTAKEQLDGGERHYQCQQCKQKVKALKQLTIHKAPYVLTVHLKRFGSHMPGQKIDKKIMFDPTLDLKPFVTGPYDGDLKYTLYGVLVHAGWSTHSGHYYCFVRTSSGMWYSLDDNQVIQVNERKVLEQKAYMLFYVRDRRNFVAKKPTDVVRKENMAINAVGRNKTYSNFSQGLKESIQNGPVEKKLNAINSSTAVAQREALNTGASKESITKETSIQKMSCLMREECSALNKDPLLECSSDMPPLKDSVKGRSVLNQTGGEGLPLSDSYVKGSLLESSSDMLPLKDSVMGRSVLNQTGGEGLPQSDSSVKGSTDTLNLHNAMTATRDAKTVECSVDRTIKKDMSNSVSLPTSSNGLQNSVTKKDLRDPVVISVNCNEDRSTKKYVGEPIAIPPNCSVSHRSPGDTCITEKTSSGKSGGFSQESSGGDSPSEKAGDNGQRTVDTVSAELSSLPITCSISIHKKALDHKPHQKLKKKLLKCPVTRMHLSSNILLRTSLSVRKRKKHKRSKQCMTGIGNISQDHLLIGDHIPTDLGPSTSEKIKVMPLGGSEFSRRKGVKSSSKKKEKNGLVKNFVTNSNGDLSVGVINKEHKERTGQNGAVLAADDQLQRSYSSASAGNEKDAIGPKSSKDSRRDSMQKGLMSMLTRGIEETIVARWDEIELYPSRMSESGGVESVSIGYVADEWDEEYDRGKRKKVRSYKNNFGGPNPFQEIATMNAELKKAKTDQSSSGNRPFRI